MGDHVRCNYCSSENSAVIATQPDIRYFPEERFEIRRCDTCRVLFTAPELGVQEMDKYYPPSYGAYYSPESIRQAFSHATGGGKENLRALLRAMLFRYSSTLYGELHGGPIGRLAFGVANSAFRFLLNILMRQEAYIDAFPLRKGTNRILYIGSGIPEKFAAFHRRQDMSICNIDINEEMCRSYAQAGFESHHGTILSTELPTASCDVIFFTHVLEHLLHPKAELRRLNDWLAVGGTVVCGFPDYGSLEWRARPVYYDVPRHRVHLTHETALMMFREAGFKVLKRIHTPYGWGLFQSRFLQRFISSKKFTPNDFNSPLPVRDWIASFAMSLVGQSGNVVYYLTKVTEG